MSAATSTYEVTFDDGRIGRRRDVEPIRVQAPVRGDGEIDQRTVDAITEAVYKHAGKYLMSRDYQVDIDLEPHGVGHGWIDAGRFGCFSIAPHRGEVA